MDAAPLLEAELWLREVELQLVEAHRDALIVVEPAREVVAEEVHVEEAPARILVVAHRAAERWLDG